MYRMELAFNHLLGCNDLDARFMRLFYFFFLLYQLHPFLIPAITFS